jgi:hypothetical protein
METRIEEMRVGAQQTLDELFVEKLIPFQLSAFKVDPLGREEYIIRFHDSRLHSVDVTWLTGTCFKKVVRAAVLDRISRLDGRMAAFRR